MGVTGDDACPSAELKVSWSRLSPQSAGLGPSPLEQCRGGRCLSRFARGRDGAASRSPGTATDSSAFGRISSSCGCRCIDGRLRTVSVAVRLEVGLLKDVKV